jgi:hypothetical protein
MKAYKVFNSDWTLKHGNIHYEVGKSYHTEGRPVLCKNGFHACSKLVNCFKYYDFTPSDKVVEVELYGEIVGNENDKKVCASDIRIIRQLSWEEVFMLCNTGDSNTGNRNTGYRNTGDCNTGCQNTGCQNTGDCDTGCQNTGCQNTGNWNTGDCNTGNRNTGDCNTGCQNTGCQNTGNRNIGDCNTGDWNTGNWNTGYFNTKEQTVFLFNKDTGKYRNEINLPSFLYFNLTVWVSCDTATKEEMTAHKQEIEICGGFLKTLKYKEAFKLAWDKASEEEHEQVKNLPNFDPDIFYEISGIRI